ncbi:SDR family NAD(P)-dependent oxidoreductase [Clostridium formicaceticum]|uniref:3-oxoacyl-[acyl-carrier-protein] reductase FabG n=1 Tax=Clostridium formicaceticum TaxID=1497 RepID=A0AAC9RNJ2_9CLOT|nr:SDR family oxidoreductase [Clostridium formicaceticum]AOY74523.1 oxidoreductase [Clostridium formicaceticum]ARE88877.1 3-oxoacyl-[acyl-carrier-protein] reductase FabG [Clostridium formicaceticum]
MKKVKKVLVTGGSKGIGEAIGKAYQAEGCYVIVADIVKSNYGDYFYEVNFAEVKEVELLMKKVFEKFQDIDIVVNNVGIGQNRNLLETKTEDFLRVLNTNLTSVFITSREFAKHRQENKEKYGRIINIASTRHLMSEKNTESYSASKGGIVSITHALAISLSDYNITVNCISPGWIENHHYEDLSEEDHNQHPSKRVGKPEDIARACLFLSNEENDFITGENIVIDGGMTKKMIYV